MPEPLDKVNPNLLKPQLMALSELHEDPQNARFHDDASIDAIAASLTKYGQQGCINITRDGKILKGNGLYRAAKKLGWEKVAVVLFDSEDRNTERGYALADNRTAELSRWNEPVLLQELPVLMAADPGFMQLLEFDREYLNKLVELVVPPAAEPEDDVEAGKSDLTTCPKCGAKF